MVTLLTNPHNILNMVVVVAYIAFDSSTIGTRGGDVSTAIPQTKVEHKGGRIRKRRIIISSSGAVNLDYYKAFGGESFVYNFGPYLNLFNIPNSSPLYITLSKSSLLHSLIQTEAPSVNAYCRDHCIVSDVSVHPLEQNSLQIMTRPTPHDNDTSQSPVVGNELAQPILPGDGTHLKLLISLEIVKIIDKILTIPQHLHFRITETAPQPHHGPVLSYWLVETLLCLVLRSEATATILSCTLIILERLQDKPSIFTRGKLTI